MARAFAQRRLLRDLAEVQREPSELVSALPLESNLFEWHANLRPSSGPLQGVVLHVRIVFPADYPDSPPNMLFPMSELPSFVHPNLYSFGLCLDILSSYMGFEDSRAGWSPAYGVRTLLLQLQSFLFEFDAAPQDHGGHYAISGAYTADRIARVRKEAARFRCTCGHCSRRPWPPLAPESSPSAPATGAIPSTLVPATMPPTAASDDLHSARQARSQAEARLEAALELQRRTAGGLRAGSVPVQLRGSAGTPSLTVRLKAISSSGYVRVGFSTSLGSSFVGWDSHGKLMLGNLAKAKKVALPAAVAGDVMGVAACNEAMRFFLNGQVVDAAAPIGSFLRDLVAGEGSGPILSFRDAVVEILDGEDVTRARDEVQRLQEEESQLAEKVRAEEAQWRAQRSSEEQRLETQRREEDQAAAALKAAEAWARVLAPPRSAALQPCLRTRQGWLGYELADLAKPLYEGTSAGPWTRMPPALLMSAFTHLEASEVPPLERACKVWRRMSTRGSLMERVQLRCFYMKTSAEEDLLGFGVQAAYHDDGNLKSVSTELDPLSATAFHQRGLRRGVWGDEFTHFLPLVLNAEHGRRAMPELEQALAALACRQDMDSRERRAFEPWMALAVVPQLMNSFVVSLMSASGGNGKSDVVPRHASEKALLGYCSFHHILLALSQEHPSIVQVANKKLQKFVAGERTKAHVPDLGQLIVYLAVSDSVSWREVAAAVVDEAHVRGVLWLLRAQPRLGRGVSDTVLLSSALQERLTSLRLLMFQSYFLRSLARPNGEPLIQGLGRLSRQFGQPTASQRELLVQSARAILAVRGWPDFYRRMGLQAPLPHTLARDLREAVCRSAELGYHGAGWLGPSTAGARGRACQVERVGVQESLHKAFSLYPHAQREVEQRAYKKHVGHPGLVLTACEEAEAKKTLKTLREIARLEQRAARGELLDSLQHRKLGRKRELEATLVMQKLRAGYARLDQP